jgi:hypothetical protein
MKKRKKHYVLKQNLLGTAYILNKNKDLTRQRPLVSYYNFFIKTNSKIYSKSTLGCYKNANDKMENHGTSHYRKLLKARILQLNKRSIYLEAIKNNTVHFDIKNQFTNLNKKRVYRNMKILKDIARPQHL